MTVINTNISAKIATNALYRNDRALNEALERLSSGKRINNAGDDAAGLAISSRMTSKIEGLQQAARNANDAISMIQTADGALKEISSMLQRMREISVQASSGTLGASDFTAIKTEFDGLHAEIQSIVDNTSWNGKVLLNNSAGGFFTPTLDFQIGANASQTITVDFGNFGQDYSSGFDFGTILSDDLTITNSAPVYRAYALTSPTTAISISDGTTTINVNSATYGSIDDQITAIQNATNYGNLLFTVTKDPSNNAYLLTYKSTGYVATEPTVSNGAPNRITNPSADAGNAINHMDLALTNINTVRSQFGASINRLEYVVNNLRNNVSNMVASRSRILDADYASETTALAKNQIIQQAGTAMLAQANQQAQSVLSLLKK